MENRRMPLDGTTEMKHTLSEVVTMGKYMKLKAKTPPKGYFYDRFGRLRPIQLVFIGKISK